MTVDALATIPGLLDALTERLRDGFPSVPITVIDRYVEEARAFTSTSSLDAVAYAYTSCQRHAWL